MSDNKPVVGDSIYTEDTDVKVPTGIDAPSGPQKDWKETVFDEDKGSSDKITVPTGIDVKDDDSEYTSDGE